MGEKMKTKMTVDLEKAIAYIECLLQGLRNGTLVFEHHEGKMSLEPGTMVELEIETEVENGTQELEIELKWSKEETGVAPGPSGILMRKFEPISE